MRNFIKAIISISLIVGVAYATNLSLFESGKILTSDKMNELVNKINVLEGQIGSSGSTPSGAVMAFNLAECPIGWSEYTPAQGRFIRGIDKTGASIDPDGQRALESTQEDAIRNITGNLGSPVTTFGTTSGPFGEKGAIKVYDVGVGGRNSYTLTFDASKAVPTAEENRPKNIALLYCVKD